MHLIVDATLCQAYGNCLIAAPELFDLDEETNVAVVLQDPTEELRSAADQAVRSCPVQAITLEV